MCRAWFFCIEVVALGSINESKMKGMMKLGSKFHDYDSFCLQVAAAGKRWEGVDTSYDCCSSYNRDGDNLGYSFLFLHETEKSSLRSQTLSLSSSGARVLVSGARLRCSSLAFVSGARLLASSSSSPANFRVSHFNKVLLIRKRLWPVPSTLWETVAQPRASMRTTVINLNGLLSIHMPAYYNTISKGVASVMVSYSSWNGKKMHANHELVTGFLKNKLKFRITWAINVEAGQLHGRVLVAMIKQLVAIIGVGCYSSKDLWTWRNEGIVLAAEETNETHDLYKLNVLERPKVVYNEKTGKYVMWMHIDDCNYTKASVGVAISDYPTGPFNYIYSKQPHSFDSRDMTIFTPCLLTFAIGG
ncbi:hypothetical protein EZV62_002671 [Acer yangbiense]|uniref:Glycoside hydrolase family 3 N-terminal domain-containing protein n=1 Tax=Acer yangbiense TaxID=1000413 RepID=A0A5C7IZU1_9ROSI|nr:hypothetical protein EZV62_002671 [Acer yangbiense]